MMASEAQLGATLQPEKLDIGQTPPKPLVKPKPRILPKPAFSEKPVTSPLPDVLGCASSPGLYSPKSPLADVPLAEKINILTGPKPYGSSTTAGLGYKRPSFSFKRQKSETAPNEGDAGNATPEEAPDPGARGSWSYSSSMTFSEPPKSFVPWSMHDAGRRKVDQEDLPAAVSPVADADLAARKTGLPPAELTDAAEGTAVRAAGAATAGRPLEERKPGSFRVKPVPVAVKPGRFPGTTVEEILARLEEGKTAAAQGPDRTWAQRQSLSFDGGCRFGSKAYSSFRRQQSGSEAVGETEEKATKESESKAGKDPSSPSTLEASQGVGGHLQADSVEGRAAVAEEDRPGDQRPGLRSASELLLQSRQTVPPSLNFPAPAKVSQESCFLPDSSWDRNQIQGQLSPPRDSTDLITNTSESPVEINKIRPSLLTRHIPKAPSASSNGASSETSGQAPGQNQGFLENDVPSDHAISSLAKVPSQSDLEKNVVPDLPKEGVLFPAASVESSISDNKSCSERETMSIPAVSPRPSKTYSEPDFIPGLLVRGVPLTATTMESSIPVDTSRMDLEKEIVSTPVAPPRPSKVNSNKSFISPLLVHGAPVTHEAAAVDISERSSEQGTVSATNALLKKVDPSTEVMKFADSREDDDSLVERVKTLKTEQMAPPRKDGNFHPQLDSRRFSEGMVHPVNPSAAGKGTERNTGDIQDVSEQTLAGSDWSLSESFEWSSPSRSMEWTRRKQSPTTSPIEEMPIAPDRLEDKSYTSESDMRRAIRNEEFTGSDHELLRPMQGSTGKITKQDSLEEKPIGISHSPPTNWNLVPTVELAGETLRQLTADSIGILASEDSMKEAKDTIISRKSPCTETADHEKMLSTTEVETLTVHKESLDESPTIQIQGLGVNLFEAKESSKIRSKAAELQEKLESCLLDPFLWEIALDSVNAHGVLESIHPILQSEPAAEACVMFNEVIRSDRAVPSWEDDSCLRASEVGAGTSIAVPDVRELKPGEGTMSSSEVTWSEREAQISHGAKEPHSAFDVSDFDPIRNNLEEKPTGIMDLDSHWLENLLSPAPAHSDITERNVAFSSRDEIPSEGQEGLLGWSQKDLRSEFGVGGPEQISNSDSRKRVWDNEFSIGGTHQSSDFSIAQMDPNNDYDIAKRVWETDFDRQNTDQSKKFDTKESDVNREFGIVEAGRDREFGIGDREFSVGETGREREFGVGEAGRDREFGVGEAGRDMEFSVGEAGRDREFGVGEAGRDREFGIGEASRDREFGIGEASRDREFGAGEAGREFVFGEVGKDREVIIGEVDREFGTKEANKDREFGVGEVSRDREFGVGEVSRDREFGVGEVGLDKEFGVHGLDKDGVLQGSNRRDEFCIPGSDLSNTLETRNMDKTSLPETDRSDFPVGFTQDPSSSAFRHSKSEELPGSPNYSSHSLVEKLLGSDLSKRSSRNESLPPVERTQVEETKEQMDSDQPYAAPKEDNLESDSCTDHLQPDSKIKADYSAKRDETDLELLQEAERSTQGESESLQAESRTLPEPEEMEEEKSPEIDFSFLGGTDMLDSTACRSRASLNRKRGHRAPVIRPGATLNLNFTESDGMFQDSTEPKPVKPESTDEEVEEPESRRVKKSPASHAMKLGLFSGFNPLALKAKLKQRKSVEEGEQVESKSQKENLFQRSKSCKVPGSGKPLVLPPKPEKSAGSESSSPQWLKALKIKKKSTK